MTWSLVLYLATTYCNASVGAQNIRPCVDSRYACVKRGSLIDPESEISVIMNACFDNPSNYLNHGNLVSPNSSKAFKVSTSEGLN